MIGIVFCFLLSLIASVLAETTYFHTDHLGSPVAITDSSGDEVWSADYEPFGKTFNEEGENRYKYNQKEYDETTGFHYYEARYYDEDLGRFTTADSFSGSLTDSQSLNRYAYAHNNPINRFDPDGNRDKHFNPRPENGVQAEAMRQGNVFVGKLGISFAKEMATDYIFGAVKDSYEAFNYYKQGKYGWGTVSLACAFVGGLSSGHIKKIENFEEFWLAFRKLDHFETDLHVIKPMTDQAATKVFIEGLGADAIDNVDDSLIPGINLFLKI